jgi:hypothetical protein
MSLAMTDGVGYTMGIEGEGMKLQFIDIKRGYLQTEAKREICVELPRGRL